MNRPIGMIFAIAAAFVAVANSAIAAPEEPSEPPIKIILHPKAEQRPALELQLLPPLYDRRPGNAAVQYLKVPHEEYRLFNDAEFLDTMQKWSEMRLDDLRKDVSGAGKKYAWITSDQRLIRYLDLGARCDSCDWDIPIRERPFYSILLPEVQASQSWARILAARARIQIADGQYADAVHTLQTGYALGRHVALSPFLVSGLVGVTIAGMMSKQVETLLQQSDSPNLYWALASLPRPLIDFRAGYEGEFAAIYLFHPELRDLEHKDYSPDEWRRLLEKTTAELSALMPPEGIAPKSELQRLTLVPAMLEGYPRAKRALISAGRSAGEVEAMPAAQVIMLYTVRTYDELRDDTFKWLSLPYPEARRGLERAEEQFKESVASSREIIPIAGMMLPEMFGIKKAEVRGAQTIAALEILEALRIHAAGHDGTLPENLKDISEVPIPLDPFSGEPFIYVRHGNSARLESPFPSFEPLRYEIQLIPEGKKP